MVYTVLDIETNGLRGEATRIHCLSYKIFNNGVLISSGSLTNYEEIKTFVLTQMIIVGHNIVRYDIPVLEDILGIKIEAILIDTLGLSWYLYPMKLKHGLEQWGDELGVAKPLIDDWSNLSTEDYIFRCESDVEINQLLFHKQLVYLNQIYDYDLNKVMNFISYLTFKLDCAREQEEVKVKIDVDLVRESLETLYALQAEKLESLTESMPKNIKYKAVTKPSKPLKKDGTLSATGVKWYELLEEHNLPQNYDSEVMVKVLEEPGNPASSSQLKDWLFSLGWQPRAFEFRKSKTGDIKQVPQIYVDDQVCPSIEALYDEEPALVNLDMLSLINHRIGIFEGYLNVVDEEGFVKAEIAGLTNTLRFKHKKPIVNLPKVFKFYGKEIRGAIIAPDAEHVLCGSDMSSLEDSTKQHYMYFYDPEYVTQMRVPGFDPHLDIGVLAGMLTAEEAELHKRKEQDFSQVRNLAKVVNFSAVYGAGPPKIAQTTGMPLSQAQTLHRTYWNRNKAVKQIAQNCQVKTVNEQMWLYNPVSKFWYSLRYEKDRFSTLNQGTGVFCFDLWVRQVRAQGIKIMLQYHDEIAFPLIKGQEEQAKTKLLEAIRLVNESVKLNVPLGVSIDFGDNYAQIH